VIGDLNLAEVLRGFADERDFNQARTLLTSLTIVDLCGPEIAIQAAKNFRVLRASGVTVRKTRPPGAQKISDDQARGADGGVGRGPGGPPDR
jgi:hypothetical protein